MSLLPQSCSARMCVEVGHAARAESLNVRLRHKYRESNNILSGKKGGARWAQTEGSWTDWMNGRTHSRMVSMLFVEILCSRTFWPQGMLNESSAQNLVNSKCKNIQTKNQLATIMTTRYKNATHNLKGRMVAKWSRVLCDKWIEPRTIWVKNKATRLWGGYKLKVYHIHSEGQTTPKKHDHEVCLQRD